MHEPEWLADNRSLPIHRARGRIAGAGCRWILTRGTVTPPAAPLYAFGGRTGGLAP
jgi:hypothetical protein